MAVAANPGTRSELRRACWIGCLLLAVAACSDEDDEVYGPTTLQLTVTADQPFDRVVLLYARVGGQKAPGVVTPGMLAAGAAALRTATLYYGSTITRDVDSETFTQSFEIPGAPLDSHPGVVAVFAIAYRRDGPERWVASSAGFAELSYPERVEVFPRSLALTSGGLAATELWGTGKQCVMYRQGWFFVHGNDIDCDAIPDLDDCDPRRFCDPEATSPAAQAACIAPQCGRCTLEGASCLLGTQLTCHNAGSVRTYTCEAGGACGPVTTCLPENACLLDCREPPYDPVACMENRWDNGVQAADAIDCSLPTQPSQGSSVSCSGGSTVELPLPFTGCMNPHVVVAYSPDLDATPVLTPPCTLRVTIKGMQPQYLHSLLVAMETATGSATVRVTLHPTDGDCSSGIGRCDAVKSTATCEL